MQIRASAEDALTTGFGLLRSSSAQHGRESQAEVVEFVDFLKSPTKYEKLGARVPKGT